MKKLYLVLMPCLAVVFLAACAAVDSDVKVPSGAYNTHDLFVDDFALLPTVSGNAASSSSTSTHSSAASASKAEAPPAVLEAATSGNVSAAINYAERLNWVMPLVEIDASRFIYHGGINDRMRDGKDKTPIYLAYDTSRLENGLFEVEFPTEAEQSKARNDIVRRILYRSNANFDTYASRLRTYDRSEALAGDTLGLISTATIGGTALVAPPVAAGIAGAHVLASGVNSNIQKDFLSGGTIDSVLITMNANRKAFQVTMTNKLFALADGTTGGKPPGLSTYESYPILDVLDDVRQLNQMSTIYGALDAITDTAGKQAQAATALSNKIKTAQTAETAQDIANALTVSSGAAAPVIPVTTGNATQTGNSTQAGK